MKENEILKKVRVTEVLTPNATILVEDIFTKEKLTMVISGKWRMSYIRLLPDDIVYMTVVPSDLKKGKYTVSKYINQNSDLRKQLIELNDKEKNL